MELLDMLNLPQEAKLFINWLKWETHGVLKNTTVIGVTIQNFGLQNGENKLVFKHQMMVFSSFLLINGEQTGVLSQYVITETIGKKPLTKANQVHSTKKEVAKKENG